MIQVQQTACIVNVVLEIINKYLIFCLKISLILKSKGAEVLKGDI